MLERKELLDHGFVELLDIMGDDDAIVDAARTSISGENVRAVQDNRGLIRYLMRNRHTGPFEFVELVFRVKMPIFVARQWVRHRTANINEISARYGELPAEYYVPHVDDIQFQSTNNKQGRGAEMSNTQKFMFQHDCSNLASLAFDTYRKHLDEGTARELARINLPLSTYTQWVWKIDLHNLFHFLALRMDSHAQKEIRVYAMAIAEMVKRRVPVSYQAFEDFRLNAVYLTRFEAEALELMGQGVSLEGACQTVGFPTKRELSEAVAKLERFNRK